jgi:hypothetical protein
MQESDDELRKYMEELHKAEVEKQNILVTEQRRVREEDERLVEQRIVTTTKSFEQFRAAVDKMCKMVPVDEELKVTFKHESKFEEVGGSKRRSDVMKVTYRSTATAEIDFWRISKAYPGEMKWFRGIRDPLPDAPSWKCLADGRWEPSKGSAGESPESLAKKFVTLAMKLPAGYLG